MVSLEEHAEGPGEKAEAAEDSRRDGPALTPIFAFGVDKSVQGPVHYVDACRILYAVGRHVAFLDPEQQQMHFLHDLRAGKVTCLAVAYNRKYLAVVEKGIGTEAAQISVYGNQSKWKRVRSISLSAELCPSKDVTSLSFSSDNKYLVTVGKEPDCTLLYWRWASGKVVGSFAIGNAKDEPVVKRLSCNPWEHGTVAASGLKELRIFKLPKEDAPVKVAQPTFVMKGEPPRFKGEITDHVWLEPESLAFSTDLGSVIVVNREEIESTFETPNPCTITALARVGKGFLAADRRGRCTLFELAVSEKAGSGKPVYVPSKSFHAMKDGQCIRSLRMSPSEDQAVCALDSSNLAILNIAGATVAEWTFSLLYRGFHQGPAYGIDVCVQRPLIATFGIDQTVRIWNFVDRQCVLAKQLDEDILSLALHPSGMYIVLGFRDKLRLCHVLADDLMMVRDFHLSGCKQVSFSHSGHLFVASNPSTTLVFNTYTLATMGTLRGHTAAVRSVCWAANDQRLVTVGMDGAVYEWKMDTFSRDQSTENVLKSVQYSCVAYGQPGGAPFYVTAGRDKICRLRHMINGACEHEVKIDDCQVTAIALVDHNRTLLAATDEGSVRVYPWFGNKHPGEWAGEKPGRFEELRLHQGAITSMCVSPDQSLLFTTGEDGSVFTCEIRTKPDRSASLRSGQSGERWVYGPDACLVDREEYRETVGSVEDLKAQIEALQRRAEYQSMVQENKRKEQVAAANEETEAVKQASQQQIDDLNETVDRLKKDQARQLRALNDAHLKTSAYVESEHTADLERADEKLARALSALEEERASGERKLDEARARHEQDLWRLREEVEEEKARARAQVEEARRQAEEARREADERKMQQDEEFEIAANRGDLRREEQRLEAEKKESELRARNSIVRRDLDGAILARKTAQEDLAKREEELQILLAQLLEGAARHQSMLAVLAEREATLHSLEQTITSLRGTNKDLEVHKYLAHHKLKELQSSVNPRELELARLKEQLREQDEELHKCTLEKDNLSVANRDQAERITGLKKEVGALQATIKARESVVTHFEHDLSVAMTEVDVEEKQRRLQKLYEKHCGQRQKGPDEEVGPEALVEMQRQRAYLEHNSRHQQKAAETLERRFVKAMKKARDENQLLIAENMDLRQDKKRLLQQLQKIEERMRLQPQLAPDTTSLHSLKPSQTPRISSARVPRFSASALAAANAVREGSAASTSRSGRVVKGSVSRSLVFNATLDELEDGGFTAGLSRPATSRENLVEAQRKEIVRLKAQLQEARGKRESLSERAEDDSVSQNITEELDPVMKSGAQTARPWTAAEPLAKLSGSDRVRKTSFKAVGLQPELLIPLLDTKVVANRRVSGAQTARPSTGQMPVNRSGEFLSDGVDGQEHMTRVSQTRAVGGGFMTDRRQSSGHSSNQTQPVHRLLLDKTTERRKSMPAINGAL